MGFPILVRWHLYIESAPCFVVVTWGVGCITSLKSGFYSVFFGVRPCLCILPPFFYWIHLLSTPCELDLSWMPQNPIDDKSTLVQIMILYQKATSLCQCWARYMWPYGVTTPQWVEMWLYIFNTVQCQQYKNYGVHIQHDLILILLFKVWCQAIIGPAHY